MKELCLVLLLVAIAVTVNANKDKKHSPSRGSGGRKHPGSRSRSEENSHSHSRQSEERDCSGSGHRHHKHKGKGKGHACDPVNGGWSDWTDGQCSTTCGEGLKNRTRTCDKPTPKNGGDNCIGSPVESFVCNVIECPVHGEWSVWADGQCSETCGEGQQTRTRTCDNPEPQYNGNECVGDAEETTTCKLMECVEQCEDVVSPCSGNGQCVNNADGYSCICDNDHFGDSCSCAKASVCGWGICEGKTFDVWECQGCASYCDTNDVGYDMVDFGEECSALPPLAGIYDFVDSTLIPCERGKCCQLSILPPT